MNNTLIGISGKKRSGKDLFFEIFSKYLSKYECKKFAGKLKTICSLITGLPETSFYDGKQYGTYLPDYEMTIRELQQKLGTESFRQNVHTNIWVNALFSEYKKDSKWIITDVRFPNEVDAIKKYGGIVIRINRPDNISYDNHLSETSLDNYVNWDEVIINNGTKEDYEDNIVKFIKKYYTYSFLKNNK